MDVERSSLCNCVVNFLLEENYLLSAFELLHELLDDGRDAQAIRLKEYFSNPSQFHPDQISRYNTLRILDPQSLLEEKESLEEKLAITEYELRLAQEDLVKVKTELQKRTEIVLEQLDRPNISDVFEIQPRNADSFVTDLGPLKDNERQDLNCAVKEYMLLAGYKLTAMTFYEEVTDQNLDLWQKTRACVPDALRHYYYQYLSSTDEAAEEKIGMLRKIEALEKDNENLCHEKEFLMKCKKSCDDQIMSLENSLNDLQKDLMDREIQVRDLKQSLDHQRKELNDCRAEITSLKMDVEVSRSKSCFPSGGVDFVQNTPFESYKEQKALQTESEDSESYTPLVSIDSVNFEKEDMQTEHIVSETHGEKTITLQDADMVSRLLDSQDTHLLSAESLDDKRDKTIGLETIQVLSDVLPRIVPYVLINHREELLPLMMCAIESHPDSSTRDSLTHTLFNLIKRPDEQQRQIIMDACVTLAKNVGVMRTEIELLPQCWEQINHMYEERRLLVAQSCGQLAGFVRPEIRDSLILSIMQQLIEDSATVVREAAAHNLAVLLPDFPNVDKYFKVEEMMFQLVCDPSGVVVDTTIKELVPALINWGDRLDHVLSVLLSHILGSAKRCPPLSGVDGSMDSHFRVLGERERWNIDVLLRLLSELLSFVQRKAIDTCPYSSLSGSEGTYFSPPLLHMYSGGHMQWPAFDWMHADCFPHLIQLVCLLPQKEDNLRKRITKFLLDVIEEFGDNYLTHIMLPVFLAAIGDSADSTFLPSSMQSGINGLRPTSVVGKKIRFICVLPLLLAGILGTPSKHEELGAYLRKLLVDRTMYGCESMKSNAGVFNAVRFLCLFKEHHGLIFNILWEMVVSSDIDLKMDAANLLKVIVPCVDVKVASSHILPALVTLGSEQNQNVKYASIEAFGAVAQHLKGDTIVDKIRVQMDAFLEDGSLEATLAVVHALMLAIPHTTDGLREYLSLKIFQFTATPIPVNDLTGRRERANAFCEAIRALDASDPSASSVREFLVPAIQNLVKDTDAMDPAHKEALEVILKERSGGSLEGLGKAMGLPSSVTSFFGDSGMLAKKDSTLGESPKAPQSDDTRFRRIMKGNFTDMLKRPT